MGNVLFPPSFIVYCWLLCCFGFLFVVNKKSLVGQVGWLVCRLDTPPSMSSCIFSVPVMYVDQLSPAP